MSFSNFTRVFAVAMMLAVMSACATSTDPSTRQSNLNTFVSEAVARQDRAVVFGTVGYTDMFNMAPPLIYFEIRDKPTDAANRTQMLLSDDMNLAGTWPGSYSLATLYLPANLQSYTYPGWRGGEARSVGRFDVAPGEVIYIGNLVFRPHGEVVRMEVEDHFDEFKRRLPPDIAARIQKRLIQVPATYEFPIHRTTRVQLR